MQTSRPVSSIRTTAMLCFYMAAPGSAPGSQGAPARKTRIRVSPPPPPSTPQTSSARKRPARARLVPQSVTPRPPAPPAPPTPSTKVPPSRTPSPPVPTPSRSASRSIPKAASRPVPKTASPPAAKTSPKTASPPQQKSRTQTKRRATSKQGTRRPRTSVATERTSRERSASEPPSPKKPWTATHKLTQQAQTVEAASKPSTTDAEDVSVTARRSRSRRRRSRTPSQSTNRTFATYMEEVSSYALLEQREVVSLAHDIRAGVEVEEAQRALTAELRRRPSLPELGERLGRAPDEARDALLRGTAAKNRLVAANLRLVSSVARRIAGSRATKGNAGGTGPSGLALEDMIQEGSVGLIRAAEKYDASRGYKFSTYATWWIRAAVMRAITTQSRSIRVPSTVVDEYARIRKEYERQRQAGVFAPSDADVAAELGITPAKLRFVLSVVTRTPASLDLAIGAPGEQSRSTLGELVEGDDRVEERMVETMQRRELDRALKLVLKPIERAAVRLRFGLDDGHPRTLREVGSMLGLSKERVRQLSFRALAKLNTPEMRKTLTDYLE